MTTSELIDAALAALDAYTNAATTAQTAAAALTQAKASLDGANQALHDDLSANGPAARVDASTTPPTVTVYTAVDPGTYLATQIRAA